MHNDFPYLQYGFKYIGVAFHAFTSQIRGSLSVHLFTHDGDQNHVYTINIFDFPYEQYGFKYQGIAFISTKIWQLNNK
jgi:hypothetical protein